MKLRSAIVAGSFAAVSGACPKIATPEAAYSQSSWPARPALFVRATGGATTRRLRARWLPPARSAPRARNRPAALAGFSAVAGSDAVAPKKNVKVLRPASVGFRTASTARSYASDATTP